jgi:hypothetical protein
MRYIEIGRLEMPLNREILMQPPDLGIVITNKLPFPEVLYFSNKLTRGTSTITTAP